LKGVAAELASRFESVEVAARDGGVNTDAQAAIHPGRRQRFGLRFRAVLVFWIEFGDASERLFWHSH
jgi:hypothetical protein